MVASRDLLVVVASLASLLGLVHWIGRPSKHALPTPFPTGPLVVAAADAPLAVGGESKGKDQCTIVFIHNRKGCVFDGRAHLRAAGADAAISNPAQSRVDGRLGWAAAAALGKGQGPSVQELRRPKGQAYGPPQTTRWRDRVDITASEALDLQPLFDARPIGYGGADVATSFRAPPLAGDGGKPHALWLLGDTFLGKVDVQKGRRLPGYFVHNSVAVLPEWANAAEEADPAQVAFWHNISAAGCPSSLFRHPAEVERGEENECHEGGEYLWPVAGLGVDLSGDPQEDPAATSKLILLATRWAYIPWIEEDVDLRRSLLNFNVLGTTIIVVDNARAPPPEWRYRTRDLPHTGAANNWFLGIAPAEPGAQLVTRREETVYLLGTSGTAVAFDTSEILGRVSAGSLLDLSLDGMEVWSEAPPQPEPAAAAAAQDKGAGWAPLERYVKGEVTPLPLTSPVYTGISLHYSEHLQCWYSVAIDWISRRAILQTAEEITGPWDATPVYDIPAPFNGTNLMAYTGKAHPELAGPDEIVFTYVANTPGVVYPLFEDGADVMYVPRFVRLKLKGGDDKRRGLKKRRWRVRQKLLEQEREQEPEPGKHRALRTRRRRRKRGGH